MTEASGRNSSARLSVLSFGERMSLVAYLGRWLPYRSFERDNVLMASTVQ